MIPGRATDLDNQLFGVVEQSSAGVMLMKLHLIQRITDHRVLVVDQPQSGDVHVVMTEILQVQSLQVLRQTTALLQHFGKYKRLNDAGILHHFASF